MVEGSAVAAIYGCDISILPDNTRFVSPDVVVNLPIRPACRCGKRNTQKDIVAVIIAETLDGGLRDDNSRITSACVPRGGCSACNAQGEGRSRR